MVTLNRPLLVGLLVAGGSILATSRTFAQEPLGADVQEFESVEDATLDGAVAKDPVTTDQPPAQTTVPDQPLAPAESVSQGGESAAAAPTPESPSTTPATTPTETTQSPSPAAEAKPVTADGDAKGSAGPSDNQPTPSSTASEPAVPSTPVATTPAANTPEAVAVKESAPAPSNDSGGVKGTYGGRIFGRHKIQLAANRPAFDKDQKCYEKFYGKPQTHISFSGEWFPLDWWINPGFFTRIGMYSVRGKAVSGAPEITSGASCETLTVDENSSTSLLLIPIQVGAKLQFSPFRRKWIVLDYWTAGELDWWQETRNSAASGFSSTSLLASGQVYTSTGRKRAVSVGASVHLLLNPLDERTVRSMIDTMGLGYVYLSGFMEKVKATNTEGLTFGRNVLGIGFTFEAYK